MEYLRILVRTVDRITNKKGEIRSMKSLISILVIIGCMSCGYKPITGTIVDAETGNPVEGAIVLVEWTKAEGVPGLVSTKSYKVVEVMSDKNGRFAVEGLRKIFIDSPNMTIYKKGYVAWNNKYIFPGYKHRTDFKWQDGNVHRLEKFRPEYSYVDHGGFISSAINSTIGGKSDKQLFLRTYSEAEEEDVIRERCERDNQRSGAAEK